MKRLVNLALFVCCAAFCAAQVPPAALMPLPRFCPPDANGKPLPGGLVYTYSAGTSSPLATFTDSSATIQNTNPVVLDSGGCTSIWLGPQLYKIMLTDANNSQQWMVDNVSDVGLLAYSRAVLLVPPARALQTIVGPLAADYFRGVLPHTTSPSVRVSILDPASVLDTTVNPPNFNTSTPAKLGQTYQVPDPQTYQSNFVLSPSSPDWVTATVYALNAQIVPYTNNPCGFTFNVTTAGTAGAANPVFSTIPCSSSAATVNDGTVVWTSAGLITPTNVLDCTKAGLTCKRTAYIYLEGGGCNNATSGLGWDTFGTNAPTPLCVTGTNIQKGVLALPSAVTHIQQASGTAAAAGTVTVNYPAATLAGDLLVATIAFDTTRTITGCTDGTNAYTQAKHVANGALSTDVWYFNGNSTAMAAASTLTCTFSGASNAAILWHAYRGTLTAAILDVTASNTGSGTAVTTGTTAGTAQATELVFAFSGALTAPTMVGSNGYVDHGKVAQSTNVTVDDQGMIAQATGTETGAFTLGSSQTWAAGVVTFKANVAAAITAQRQFALPAFYSPSAPVTAGIKWQAPQPVLGAVDVALGAQIVCTVDGASDDPAFNTAVTATPAVNPSAANLITTTSLASLTNTGCAASNLMHLQIERLRYNVLDTYEGWVYMNGTSLQFGVTQ